MAKTTHGGPSYNEHELSDPHPPEEMIRHLSERYTVGDERLLVGANSRPSGQSESWSSDGETRDPQLPAHTTENPSEKLPEEETNSTAPLTAGNGQTTEERQSDDPFEVPPYDEWSNSDLKEECRKRGLAVSGNHDALVTRLEDNDAEEAEAAEENE